MRHLILLLLLLLINADVFANKSTLLKSPTDLEVIQWVTYKEGRGEKVETIRGVIDVVNHRVAKNNKTILETISEKGQFPYIKKTGIRRVKDKKFLTKFWKAYNMEPVLKDYYYFNHVRHKWGKKTRKLGNLFFSK